MKIEDMEFVYCLGKYEKEQCPKCKRNIELYEGTENLKLYWTERWPIVWSKAKRCPEYRALKGETK